jgi:hypothetical protein
MRSIQITIYLAPDLTAGLDREVRGRRARELEVPAGLATPLRGPTRSDVVRDALLAYLPAPKPPALSPDVDRVLP